jgi:dye decolorizing peroxidase
VIPEFSHMRRARPDDTTQRIFRRPTTTTSARRCRRLGLGLVFVSFQADVVRSSRPSSVDLDDWTCSTNGPLRSDRPCSPFPGCAEGGYIGETLLA